MFAKYLVMTVLFLISHSVVQAKGDLLDLRCRRLVSLNLLGKPAPVENLQIRVPGFVSDESFLLGMTKASGAAAEQIKARIDDKGEISFRTVLMEIAVARSMIPVARYEADWSHWRSWRESWMQTTFAGYWEARSMAADFILANLYPDLARVERKKLRTHLSDPIKSSQKYGELPNGKRVHLLDTDVGAGKWRHPNAEVIAPVMTHVEKLFQRTMRKRIAPQDLIKLVAEMHWWVAHIMPLRRGTAASMDAFTKAVFYAHGIVPGKWKVGIAPDILAFGLSLEEFVSVYALLFE